MADTTPLSLLRNILDLAAPYLPAPVRTTLSLALSGFDKLPPVFANVLPVLLTIFAAYTAVTSMYSTVRYTIRTTWWLFKWGTVIAVIAWAFGGGGGGSSSARSYDGSSTGSGLLSTLYNGYQHFAGANGPSSASSRSGGGAAGMADFVQQAAAGLGGNNNAANNNLGFLGNFIPKEYRTMAESVLGSGSGANTRPASSSYNTRRRAADDDFGLDDDPAAKLSEFAGSWLSNAWDSLTGNEGDRWSESRDRRKTGRQHTR